MITSYTSLDRVIDFLAHLEAAHWADPQAPQEPRIVIGHEPSRARRKDFRDATKRFEQEITDFWLGRGISIARSAYVVAAIQCLQRDSIQVRSSGDRIIHAKIYVTEAAATLGSSNYSISGMRTQAEANCRFTAEFDVDRYDQTAQLAEAIWQEAHEYKEGLLKLLYRLLTKVDWQEALGRACAELLEGTWAGRDILDINGAVPALWPSQRAGVAQALWVLGNAGSVLVADATGSGKTRMGTQLLLAMKTRRLRSGATRTDSAVLICPPAVEPQWRRESIACGLNIERHSHGVLSNQNAAAREDTVEAVRRASILAVDEAHHYLNRATARTQVLYRNLADSVVLFTATPINRGAQDLLAIVDLLGADNFDDHILKTVERAWSRRKNSRHPLMPDEEEQIRQAIQRFTVRRTKTMLNALVAHDPEAYVSDTGTPCKYPEQTARPYPCHGLEEDRRLAAAIREEASKLRGLTHFQQPLRLPALLKEQGVTPEKYLQRREKGARGLAMYHVFAALRSSRAALLEHLRGTEHARLKHEITSHVKAESTGNVIGRLREIAGNPPKSHLGIALPDFLTSVEKHRQACLEEVEAYERIEGFLSQMSSDREDSKADLLTRRLGTHARVLAFDSYLITLHDLKRRLDVAEGVSVILATGESKSARAHVQTAFHRSSTDVAIALCSDALAEGVNLQGASAVVLLDMPSVIRVAEQRIGRIDRMDTPHPKIEVFWPDDAPEFAIRSNELFLSRVKTVADLIGSNIELPPLLKSLLGPEKTVGIEQMQRILSYSHEDPSTNIGDAFHPIRGLVEGPDALIRSSIYESVRKTHVRIRTAVGVVEAEDRWGFYAIKGSERSAPRWVYLDNATGPVSDLVIVVQKLRERLGPSTKDRVLDAPAARAMTADIAVLQRTDEELLPRRKRRALELMRSALDNYSRTVDGADVKRKQVLRQLQQLVSRSQSGFGTSPVSDEETTEDVIDFNVVADWWMDVIRPVWQVHLSDPRRTKPARLSGIKRALLANPITTDELETLFAIGSALWIEPVANRIVAAIVGVPDPEEPISNFM